MTTCRRGDIVLVPVPFTDLSTNKKRPALVISANWYNTCRRDCIILAITSTRHRSLERDEVLLDGLESQSAGLLWDSVIRAGSVFTISQGLIDKRLGTAPAHKVREAVEKLTETLSG